MKKVVAGILAVLLLTACAARPAEVTPESEPQSVPVSESASSLDSEESSEDTEPGNLENEEMNESEEDTEIGGSADMCTEHSYTYHSVDSSLVDYVGQDKVHEWYNAISARDAYNRMNEDFSILSFIQEFDIPKDTFIEVIRNSITDSLLEALGITYDEYLEEYGYTDEQIDALYSGDQAEINRAFCGEMAYYNEADGQLYSVNWLSDHTAEDYAEAGLPETEIERILDLASSSGGSYAALAQEAASAAAAYASLVEESADLDYDLNAIGGDMIQWDYNTNYTNIDGELIRYVGSDAFQSWVGEGYNPDVNLQTFIQQFGLTKDEFLQVTEQMPDYIRLSAEEIDALFSGDQAEINRTFASPYAAVSESGEIYTIFWLAEHDEADYAAAGLTAEAVGKAVDACVELGGLDSYVASAETALASMEDTVTE